MSVALFSALLQYSFVVRGGFYLDDIRNLAQARRNGLSWTFLLSPVGNEHFQPAYRFVDWLVAEPFNRSFPASAAISSLFVGGAVYCFGRLLQDRFGPQRRQLLAATLFGSSWMLIATGQWHAGAMGPLPGLFFVIATCLWYTRWRATRQPQAYVLACGSMAGALLFWEQSLALPLYLALFGVLVMGPAKPFRSALDTIRECLPSLVPFLLMDAVFFVYVTLQPWHLETSIPHPGAWMGMMQSMLFRGLLPGLVGTGVGTNGALGPWERASQVLALSLVILGLALAVYRQRHWLRSLSFFVLSFLVVAATIGFTRLPVQGPMAGSEPRYLTPLLFLFFFAVVAATQTRRSETFASTRRPSWRTGPSKGIAALLVLTLALGAYFWNLTSSYHRLTYPRVTGVTAAEVSTRIARSVRRVESIQPLSTFVNTELPVPIFYSSREDENELSVLGSYWSPRLSPLGTGERPVALDHRGVVHEAEFLPLPARAHPLPLRCRSGVCDAFFSDWETLPGDGYVRLRIHAGKTASITLDPTVAEGKKVVRPTVLDVPSGTDSMIIPLWTAKVKGVSVHGPPEVRIDDVEIGTLRYGAAL